MSAVNTPWPCPVCTELLPIGYHDCAACSTSAEWIDLLRAFDFSLRRYELWKLEGALDRDRYRQLISACSRQRDALVDDAQKGRKVPDDMGLPSFLSCWTCQQPVSRTARFCQACGAALLTAEVRLVRYQAFLRNEVKRQEEAGLIAPAQAQTFMRRLTSPE